MKFKIKMPVIKTIATVFGACLCIAANAQKSYTDSLHKHIEDYIHNHEVIKGKDRKYLQFFPVDENYKVVAKYESIKDAPWFNLPTSGGRTKSYKKAGKLSFQIKGKEQALYIYQSQTLLQDPKYWDLLFLPFIDNTSGNGSYETGRYLDFKLSDLKNNSIIVDFGVIDICGGVF